MAEKIYTSAFEPDQVVYHVALTTGIRHGIVDKIQVLDDEATTFIYYVLFDGATRASPITSDLYADLGDAQAGSIGGGALEAYQVMIESSLV